MITATVTEAAAPHTVVRTGCCDAAWTGLTRAHCAGCHETFTTPVNFDRHRRYGKCRSPESVGLVVNDRGLWHQPGPENADPPEGS